MKIRREKQANVFTRRSGSKELRPPTHAVLGQTPSEHARRKNHHPNVLHTPSSPANRAPRVLAHTNPRNSCMSAGTNSEEHASVQAAGRWSSPIARAPQGLHPSGILCGLLRAYFGWGLPHPLPFHHWLLQAHGPPFAAHQWEGNYNIRHSCARAPDLPADAVLNTNAMTREINAHP